MMALQYRNVGLEPLWTLLETALLEPQAPDSFTSWGFFNAAFEQKEYIMYSLDAA